MSSLWPGETSVRRRRLYGTASRLWRSEFSTNLIICHCIHNPSNTTFFTIFFSTFPTLKLNHSWKYKHFFSVLVPPNIIDDESSPSSVSVRENQNLSLTCKAEGSPNPKISWKREDGNHIATDRKKKGKYKVRLNITFNNIIS